jgi:hypothetical protein
VRDIMRRPIAVIPAMAARMAAASWQSEAMGCTLRLTLATQQERGRIARSMRGRTRCRLFRLPKDGSRVTQSDPKTISSLLFDANGFMLAVTYFKGEHPLQDPDGPEILLIVLIVAILMVAIVAITIIPYWKIYSKTGQPGAMALLQLVPLVNIIMLYVLVFTEWPIEREIRAARREDITGR